MSTQMNGQMLGGTVPLNMGQPPQQGNGQGGYNAFAPPQQPAPQMVQPTGQQMQNGNAGYSYGIDALPPAPQPQLHGNSYTGAAGNYGLQSQWQQPQQQGTYTGQPLQPQPSPQQQYTQQPYGAPQQQAPTTQVGLQTRLDGPGIPQALRGRSLGEAIQLYSALEASWAQRQAQPATPAQQSLSQMQPQQATNPAAQGAQQSAGTFWQNPEARLEETVSRAIESRLAPMIQHTQQQAVTQAYTTAKAGIADFEALEADAMQMLANADPQSLANPATWIGAADIVRGRQMREGRYQPPQQQPSGASQLLMVPGQQTNPAMMRMQPASTAMPAYGFFTEGPTAPNVSQFGGASNAQPTQGDFQAAAKFGMPIGEYMAWKVGAAPQQYGPNGQVGQSQQSYFGGGR